MRHGHIYLVESDDEQDDNYAAANTFNISCDDGSSCYSLSAINFSVSATSNVVGCLILTSDLCLQNDPLSNDDMVDWDNDSMLGIGSGDTNIDEVEFMLHNPWYGEMALVAAKMDAISLWYGAMYAALLHASGISPADKIKERITFPWAMHVYI